jgi:hypothetical protein
MLSRLKKLHLGRIVPVTVVVILGASAVAAGATPAARVSAGQHGVTPSLVASVNGDSTAGTCGSSGATFTDSADATPSFLDVCVASRVKALGALASGTLTATSVTVVPPRPVQADGIVTSVNGVPTAGTCGVSGATGTFTLVGGRHQVILSVDVTSTTTFTDSADAAPSFLDVCVASRIKALGALASGTLTATSVTVVPPGNAGNGGKGGHRHHGHGRR